MKKLLLFATIVLSFSVFTQPGLLPEGERGSFSSIKAISIDFKDFALEEYKKLSPVSKKSANNLAHELIERLEEETEGEVSEKSFLKRKTLEVVDNINVVNFIRNQYRWLLVNSKDDPEMVVDLVSQHIITHSLEVFLGPLLTAKYALNGGSPAIAGLMGVVSFVIAIPGLDPVCMLGFAAYRYSPIYRTAFRATRMTLFMLPKYALQKLNMGEKLAWLFAKQERRDFVIKALEEKSFRVLKGPEVLESGDSFDFEFELGKDKVLMNFKKESAYKGLYLESLTLKGNLKDHSLSDIKKLGKDLRKLFGWNVSQGVKQALARLRKGSIVGIPATEVVKSTYYVHDLKTGPQETVVLFFEDSLSSRGKSLLRRKIKDYCSKLLVF